MTETFEPTIGIVFGILFPILFLAWSIIVGLIILGIVTAIQDRLEKRRKTAPYDTVETHFNVQDKSLNVRFIKNKKAVWISTITDKELRES